MVALVALAAFGTSILSGILGMAGGLILMGVLGGLLPVADAMVVHGSTQIVANGARAWQLREHVDRRVLWGYCAGAALAFVLGMLIRVVPSTAALFLFLGAVPFVARLLPPARFSIDAKYSPVLCGFLVMAVQLVAGVAGPVLDVFFIETHLDRKQVVATKAVTQVLAHLLKIVAFASLATEAHLGLVCAGIVAAALGTRVGVAILERTSDETFRGASRWTVLAIGAVWLIRGAFALWRPGA